MTGGGLLFLAVWAAAILYALLGRRPRPRLAAAGRKALAEQPSEVVLTPLPLEGFRDPVMAEWLTKPLREKGFADLGVFQVFPLTDVRLGILVNERDGAAAFLTEHPKAPGISLELNSRYVDGSTTMLINRADRGVPPPPFFRVAFADPQTPSGALYERFLRERSTVGLKPVTADNVIGEYQAAWARMARWQKDRGLSEDEVAKIARSNLGYKPVPANAPPSMPQAPSDSAHAPCPHCGTPNEKGREYCWACYASMSGRDSAALTPQLARPGTGEQAWSADFPGEAPQDVLARKTRAAQAILALPGLLVLLLALHNARSDYRRLQGAAAERDQRTARAEATITEVHDTTVRGGNLCRGCAGTFVFTTAAGETVTSPLSGAGSVGEKLLVHYDPRDVRNIRIGEEFTIPGELAWDLPMFLLAACPLLAAWALGRRTA